MSLPYSHHPCKSFTPPTLRTQGLDKIERYFKDYKPQIKNRPAGIGPSAKGEEI